MKVVLFVVIIIVVFISGAIIDDIWVSKILIREHKNGEKLLKYYRFFNQWLRIRQNGYTLAGYIKEQGINNVAIYGIAEFGQRLYDELIESGITVKYIIDNDPNAFFYNYEILSMNDEFVPVDAIIVTPILTYEEIKKALRKKVDCPIISLELLLFNARKRDNY